MQSVLESHWPGRTVWRRKGGQQGAVSKHRRGCRLKTGRDTHKESRIDQASKSSTQESLRTRISGKREADSWRGRQSLVTKRFHSGLFPRLVFHETVKKILHRSSLLRLCRGTGSPGPQRWRSGGKGGMGGWDPRVSPRPMGGCYREWHTERGMG